MTLSIVSRGLGRRIQWEWQRWYFGAEGMAVLHQQRQLRPAGAERRAAGS